MKLPAELFDWPQQADRLAESIAVGTQWNAVWTGLLSKTWTPSPRAARESDSFLRYHHRYFYRPRALVRERLSESSSGEHL